MKTEKVKILKIILLLLIIIESISIIAFSSLAYFKFQKIYEGNGDLPILNISKKLIDEMGVVHNNEINSTYNGQDESAIKLIIDTNGNNINGFVRVKINVSWTSSNLVADTISFNYDTSIWEIRNGIFYSINPIEPEQEMVLFDKIIFSDETTDYQDQSFKLRIFLCEIHQTINLPENW